ncbi:MAG: RIP metalloprotease RseP [Vicinamibacteria bacterium]|nr:RIP metalloprotease RseP [Vicinamibacteria bacterium]
MNQFSSLPTTIGAFIVVLGLIIFVHELGHFLSAKAFGMRVFIFSFGFGRRLLGFKWGETDYRLSLIPLGGYVKLEGEPDDLLSEKADGEDFMKRPRWQRLLMYLAGPAMNAVLTVAVLWVLYMVGFGEPSSLFDKPVIGGIDPEQPAAVAGLQPGDEIVAIDGKKAVSWQDVIYQTSLSPGREIEYRIRRDGRERIYKIQPETSERAELGTIGVSPLVRIQALNRDSPAEKAGLLLNDGILSVDDRPVLNAQGVSDAIQKAESRVVTLRIYRDDRMLGVSVTPRMDGGRRLIGVSVGERLVMRKHGPAGAFGAALRRTWEWTSQIIDVLRRLVTGRLSVKTMSGPIGIAKESGARAKDGPIPFFGFLAYISLNIGILNLVPLVPLDGGHIFLLLVESIARRDLSLKVKIWIANVGVVLLLALMLLVIFYADLSRLGLFRNLFK